ncbi:MAG: tetratricopeptide repeat protein [Thermodesulfovibrionales bacterium]|nr:tetratricopeptide repeat protein [Thermodesulfovibrionales bacterium]
MNIQQEIQKALNYFQAGDLQQAKELCRRVLKKQPEHGEVLYFLGVVYSRQGNHDLAIQTIKKALEFYPNNPDAYHLIGMSCQEQGKTDEAIEYYRKTIECNPGYAEAYNNLANLLKERLQTGEAVGYYQKALDLKPDLGTAWYNLGVIFHEKDQHEKAAGYLKKALRVDPANENIYHILGLSLNRLGEVQEAIECFEKAVKLDPDRADIYTNLANTFHEKGDRDEAERCYRRALQLQPDASFYYSNLLLSLNYNPRYDMQTIYNEHMQFAERYAKLAGNFLNADWNERAVDRRLRIGYVSPDFRQHPVAYFMEPVLRVHDHKEFEIFCYADVMHPDDVTVRIKGLPDHWRSIYGKSHEEVAALIRDDKIDLLVDLAGHSAHNRLLVFARKPAPVQVSWIGYPATTGLAAIDYRIVDRYTDPPGMTEEYYAEKLIRMPDCFLCYLPEKDAPEVNDLPALKNGHVTFGCFNNFAKVSGENLVLWARILRRMPGSRLIMKSKGLSSAGMRGSILDFFRQQEIDAGRIELLSRTPSVGEHLALYNRIDMALDTFPYHGTTTTCEALWMGVPVVTLEGKTYASRAGVSLLTNTGLAELIAQSPEEYVENVVHLSSDMPGLASLRLRLRDMVSQSPLTDAKRFTASLAKAYREMWTRWCGKE